MSKKQKKVSCCGESLTKGSACRVDSLISVDERGQMILPKAIRNKANINAGDKLVVVSWENNGRVCCISLVKADDFAGVVKGSLGPIMKELLKK